MSVVSTRVVASELGQFIGQMVRVVGIVSGIDGSYMMIKDDQGIEVKVTCKGHPRFSMGTVEVIGMVSQDLGLEEMMSTQMKDGMDLALYREAIAQTHRFQNIFPISA
eukprot:CAMPEP_0206034018 /NCGR_PEP_ID=MMETSP1466-20131121/1066_1 /ASSEMBLY_ACC=CAM_ASM_001126 /TAXON_ID=44452 /ORGANISM="Pavlova gyrans, Strain CCMP608" /LENGTH=107 /DNA_ID=CAMNT_0053408271 /DNA_START=9 /DNA_END=332 /DNA_ORIENTATION=-